MIRQCKNCGIPFVIPNNHKNKIYCSLSCSNLARKNIRLCQNEFKYNQDPKTCKNCCQPIPYNKRRNSFCSKSCSTIFNNKQRPKSIYKKQRQSLLQTLGLLEVNVNQYMSYLTKCKFNMHDINLSKVEGFHLLKRYGMYSPKTNPLGVSLDHIYSVRDGYESELPRV